MTKYMNKEDIGIEAINTLIGVRLDYEEFCQYGDDIGREYPGEGYKRLHELSISNRWDSWEVTDSLELIIKVPYFCEKIIVDLKETCKF